jgi:predicted  nucleic acid-binding Zn-ribbon protein
MDEPILSVDDLVLKIGTLVVEKMELEKKLMNIAKLEDDYKGAIVREQDLRRQLEELAKRYNEVVEQLNQEKLKVASLQQELEEERSKRIALEEKLSVCGDKGKKRN